MIWIDGIAEGEECGGVVFSGVLFGVWRRKGVLLIEGFEGGLDYFFAAENPFSLF